MSVSIILPFHQHLEHLRQSLPAVRNSMPDAEVLIAADGAREDCRPLAQMYGARVIEVGGPSGPATARNRAAAQASGDVLVFVDADVVPAPDALPGLCRLLAERLDVAGVFGAYDLRPAERGFMSQYKNLSHAWVHENAAGDASTFWAGLGAIRAAPFRDVGGFDERFRRPSVEDVDLGYRIVASGQRLLLDPRFRGTHLKRWTLGSSIRTEVTARGIPWTQLIHRFGAPKNQMNLSAGLRLSVVLSYVLLVALLLAPASRVALTVAALAGLGLAGLNVSYYRWFLKQRGPLFALGVFPAHVLHHLCNGVSFLAGTVIHLAARAGWRLPGMLPGTVWRSPDFAAPAASTASRTT